MTKRDAKVLELHERYYETARIADGESLHTDCTEEDCVLMELLGDAFDAGVEWLRDRQNP